MSLLRKAENVRREGGGAVGLLAQAMVYRRSMEAAGLLSKAAHLRKKTAGIETAGEGKGLLQKAAEIGVSSQMTWTDEVYEEGPEGQGLLARALKFHRESTRYVTSGTVELRDADTGITGTTGAVEFEQLTLSNGGLLAKALRYRRSAPESQGLLQRAEEYALSSAETMAETIKGTPVPEERASEEEEHEVIYEPVETQAGFLEEAQIHAEEKAGPELKVLSKPEEQKEPEAVKKPEPEQKPAKKKEPEAPVPVGETRLEAEETLQPEIISEMLLQYIEKRDTLALTQLLSRIIAREGYETLLEQVLKAAVRIGKGKRGALFTAQKSSFVPEYVYGIEWNKKGRRPSPARQLGIRLRKKSALVKYLTDHGTSIVKSASIEDDRVKTDLAVFGEFESFTLLPLVTGEFLSGIILIGNHSKRPRHDSDGLLFLARIFSIHLYTFVLERSLQKTIDEYSDRNRELTSLLSLYDYSGLHAADLDEVLKNIAEAFGIDVAVLTGGWDSRGPVRIYAGFGLSEKGMRYYKISKTDRDIKEVIKNGIPRVLPEAEKRLDKLPEEDRKRINTFAAIPVVFNGETLALLLIHRMKGVNTRINGRSAGILKNIANTLVPFVLNMKMTELEPFEVLETLLKREAQRAKKKRAVLNIVAFKIKNYRAIIRDSGFRRYRNLLHQFHSLVRKSVGKGDIVQTVSLNKVILLLIRKDQKQVGETIKKVKSATSVLVDKKKAGVALSYSPLRTSYPNESKSIPEILQLIE